LAKAAPAADDLPAAKTVASQETPSRATTLCIRRAGGSSAPANADPNQSRMARLVSVITEAGKSAYSLPAKTSTNRWLAAIVTGSLPSGISPKPWQLLFLDACSFNLAKRAGSVDMHPP
jgi:hypothetical protein